MREDEKTPELPWNDEIEHGKQFTKHNRASQKRFNDKVRLAVSPRRQMPRTMVQQDMLEKEPESEN